LEVVEQAIVNGTLPERYINRQPSKVFKKESEVTTRKTGLMLSEDEKIKSSEEKKSEEKLSLKVTN